MDRLEALMLYIANETLTDNTVGKTRLAKLCFWSDFLHFKEHGTSISGARYFKLKEGPVAENFRNTWDRLLAEDVAVVRNIPSFHRDIERLIPREPTPANDFSATEIEVIQRTIRQSWGKTARQASDETHEFIGYDLAEMNQEIPIGTILLTLEAPEPTDDDVAWGLALPG